jgi:DDE family transposase
LYQLRICSSAVQEDIAMFFTSLLERFVKQSPLAVMTYSTIVYALNASALDRLFNEHATVQYKHKIAFSALVDMMSLVVCHIYSSVNAAYTKCKAKIGASLVAVYGKLRRTELPILAAFVDDTAHRLGAVVTQLQADLPSPVPGYRVQIIDGNHLAATERRLEVLRNQAAAPLPGQALVVYDPQLDLMTHLLPSEDGHAQERSLLNQVLPLIHEGEIWIEDRNFCTTEFVFGIQERKAYFIIRQHAGNLHWEEQSTWTYCGRSASGEVYEQSVRLWTEDGREMVCRRIRLQLDQPTRDGDRELYILSNLPKKVRAVLIANAYGKRWTIEVGFQKLATVLESEIDTLAYPKAALFGFAVGVAAYNVMSVVQAALRSEHGRERVQEEVSTYYIAEELSAISEGMKIAIPWTTWMKIASMSVREFATWLKRVARHADLEQYKKHPRGPKKERKKLPYDKRKPHVATARELWKCKVANK